MPKEVIYPNCPAPDDAGERRTVEVGWEPGVAVQIRIEIDYGNHGESIPVALDRQQINKLIRTLRRARDQAYGQDE